MSLNYDLSKLDAAKREKFFPPRFYDGDETPYMSPKLDSMIFWCMGTGIGTITADNYQKAFFRYLRASGYDGEKAPYLTLAHFEAAIGLVTNVTNMSDRDWNAWQKKREAIRAAQNRNIL